MSLVSINLFAMSVYGGILILIVLLLRQLFRRKLPGRTFSVLWCIVLFRLIVPFSVPFSFSAYSLMGQRSVAFQDSQGIISENRIFGGGILPSGAGGENIPVKASAVNTVPAAGNAVFTAGDTDAFGASGLGSSDRERVLRIVGMGGTILCGIAFTVMYLCCIRIFKTAVPSENRFIKQWLRRNRLRRKVDVRQSDRIASPLTYGAFRPVILLPKELEDEEERKLEYILQHEMIHIRRFDGLLKLVVTAAVCLHWFNPLVWVMYILLNRDIELACDEEVLRTFGGQARKGYALTLIGMEERNFAPVSLYSGFGKNAVEERVGAIMKYRKKTKIAIGFASVMVLSVALLFATSAKAGETAGNPEEESYLAENGTNRPEGETDHEDVTLTDPPVGIGTDAGGSGEQEAGIPESGNPEVMPEEPALFSGMSYAAGEEDRYNLTYMIEGMEESEPAWLEYGQGYCILIPKEDWKMSAPEEWVSELNENVTLRIEHFSGQDSEYRGKNRDEIAEAFIAQGYQSQYTEFQFFKEENGMIHVVEIRSSVDDVWGIFYNYPSEAEGGFGVRLRAIAQNFGILSAANPVSMGGVSATAAREIVLQFMSVCQEGYIENVSEFLSESFTDDLDILKELTEWKTEELNLQMNPERDTAVASVPVKTTESEEDSLDYLTIELTKEEGVWKISSLGVEK